MTDHATWRDEMRRRERREDRRFHVIMGSSLGLFVLAIAAFVWLAVATEPRRHAEYLADCQAKGFTATQCQFLYAEGRGMPPMMLTRLHSVRRHVWPPVASDPVQGLPLVPTQPTWSTVGKVPASRGDLPEH